MLCENGLYTLKCDYVIAETRVSRRTFETNLIKKANTCSASAEFAATNHFGTTIYDGYIVIAVASPVRNPLMQHGKIDSIHTDMADRESEIRTHITCLGRQSEAFKPPKTIAITTPVITHVSFASVVEC